MKVVAWWGEGRGQGLGGVGRVWYVKTKVRHVGNKVAEVRGGDGDGRLRARVGWCGEGGPWHAVGSGAEYQDLFLPEHPTN